MYICIYQNDLIDKETLRNIDIALVSLLLTLKGFDTSSLYFIEGFGEVLPAALTSRDQSTDK